MNGFTKLHDKQAVSCSLSVVGFGESVAALFGLDNEWVARGIGAAVIVLLLGRYRRQP